MKHMVMAVLILLLAAPLLHAQTETLESFLVPMYVPGELPGAFGSRWKTEFWVRNGNAEAAHITGFRFCPTALPMCETGITLAPGQTVKLDDEGVQPCHGHLSLMGFARRSHAANLQFNLRVADARRVDPAFGTEVPIVREADYRSGPVHLLNIPVQTGYRHTLRIYLTKPANLDATYGWTI